MNTKPTVGRAVHYYEDGQGPFAATITAVHSDTNVSLAVMKPYQTSLYTPASVFTGPNCEPRWEWPPRV